MAQGTSRGRFPGTGLQTPGEWLAWQAIGRPDAVTSAGQIIAAGWRSSDAVSHARQMLERRLGADPHDVFGARDYRFAADWLAGEGAPQHGEVLDTIADADEEFRAVWPKWEKRYSERPETITERRDEGLLQTGTVVELGRSWHGIDGSWYARAKFARSGRPAIVVTTGAMTEEVLPFYSRPDAEAWLRSRGPSSDPMTASGNSIWPSRTIWEETLLAWLMRNPGDTAAIAAELAPSALTSHLRADLLEALRWSTGRGGTPEYEVIARAYERQLMRAPGWMAGDIGWPGATRALTYLRRLTVTSVTLAQAQDAVHALATADATATRRLDPASTASEPAGPLPQPWQQPGHAIGPAKPVLQPPPSVQIPPAGPVQRP